MLYKGPLPEPRGPRLRATKSCSSSTAASIRTRGWHGPLPAHERRATWRAFYDCLLLEPGPRSWPSCLGRQRVCWVCSRVIDPKPSIWHLRRPQTLRFPSIRVPTPGRFSRHHSISRQAGIRPRRSPAILIPHISLVLRRTLLCTYLIHG